MCGIVGRWDRGNGAGVAPARIEAALASIRHRGPDDEGYVYVDTRSGGVRSFGGDDTAAGLDLPHVRSLDRAAGDLVLGARRLAIQDRSPAGHLPMRLDELDLCVAYNGEIYNFHALRAELEADGRTFRTGSDTEVLLHAYDAWGLDCLDRFNGMWAFALWDGRRRKLVLARDRYGVKPLYLDRDGTGTAFASELKGLVALRSRRPEPNERIVDDYLALGLVDHLDETFFDGIVALEPGHLLELSADASAVPRAWYRLPADESAVADPAGTFARLFEDAVGLRLIADVPVGTCLSGGLDSSAVVVQVDRLLRDGRTRAGTADRQLTFSARYDDPAHDEGRFIDAVVAATDAEPHVVRPTGQTLRDDLTALVAAQDEPFGSTSIYAQYCVFRLARASGCVVTLDGQGGDETAGGYMHYFGPNLARLVRAGRIGRAAREAAALRRFHPDLVRALPTRTGAALLPWRTRELLARRSRRPPWVRGRGSRSAGRIDALPRDPLRAQIYRDVTLGLKQLLRFADRNSMAHSVESRLPFLDVRLLETFYAAPAEAKLHGGVTKVALRRGLATLLPEAVLDRHDKIGFSTPEQTWFRTSLRDVVDDVVASPSFRRRAWNDAAAVDATWRRFLAGDDSTTREVWRWVNLELWYRAYVD
jgi:asparagine synthase (glutamine-hydrolysing)